MNYSIKNISDGGDFEVYENETLIATCGTEEMAINLINKLKYGK